MLSDMAKRSAIDTVDESSYYSFVNNDLVTPINICFKWFSFYPCTGKQFLTNGLLGSASCRSERWKRQRSGAEVQHPDPF